MRKSLALLAAAALIVAVAAFWRTEGSAVSVVPGWHVPILAPYAIIAIIVSAVMVATALAIALTQLRGGNKRGTSRAG